MQIADWIRTGFIFRHLVVTMQETIIGFLLGTLLGVAVGFLFAHWEKLARIFDPLMVALNAMPRVVLAPLFILWFGLGLLSKVVMVVSLVFFVVFFSTYTGIREVDRDLVNNARILGASPRHMIRHVLLPSALTWIFASLRTSVGFALIGAVVAVLGSGGAPASRAAEKVTVGVGGVALMVYLPTALAKAKGYFAEEGLDVEILDIKGGGSQAASALIGGSVDFSANAIDHAIK